MIFLFNYFLAGLGPTIMQAPGQHCSGRLVTVANFGTLKSLESKLFLFIKFGFSKASNLL